MSDKKEMMVTIGGWLLVAAMLYVVLLGSFVALRLFSGLPRFDLQEALISPLILYAQILILAAVAWGGVFVIAFFVTPARRDNSYDLDRNPMPKPPRWWR